MSIWAILTALRQFAALIAAALGFARQVADTAQTESDKASGRAEAERDQAREGARVEGAVADAAAKSVSEDDAIERMKRGDG